MAKQITAGQLVRNQNIVWEGKVERVRRVRLVAHDTVLLAVGDVEVRVPIDREYQLVE